ncbi:tetratricopeptide repeat protein [Aliikangiella sp. IMCC44632]
MIKGFKWASYPIKVLALLGGSLIAGCSEAPQESLRLLVQCENHYRATSYVVALDVCAKAGELGEVGAQYRVANILYYDLAKQGRDLSGAFSWYKRAAESGLIEAQTTVGFAYLNGDGVAKSLPEAVNWLTKSADQGDTEAAFSLGNIYFETPLRDLSTSVDWFRRAANAGHAMSANNLAWLYATSEISGFRDVKKARFWAKRISLEDAESPQDLAIYLDTIAAVEAADSQFDKAVEIQQKAISHLPEDVEEDFLLEFQKHLESYQSHQPWIEPINE